MNLVQPSVSHATVVLLAREKTRSGRRKRRMANKIRHACTQVAEVIDIHPVVVYAPTYTEPAKRLRPSNMNECPVNMPNPSKFKPCERCMAVNVLAIAAMFGRRPQENISSAIQLLEASRPC